MRNLRSVLAIALAVGIGSGCGAESTEPIDLDGIAPGPSFSYEEIGDQTPPPEAGPEYQGATYLSVEADAGFAEGYAYGQSVLNYAATNAIATVSLVTAAGTFQGVEEESYLFPWGRGMTASTNVYLGNCIGTIHATATGKVWNQLLTSANGWLVWGTKQSSEADTVNCAYTPPGGGGGGGGGGSGGDDICYEVWLHWPDGSHPDVYLGLVCEDEL